MLDQFYEHWSSIPRVGHVPQLSDYLDRPHVALQPWSIIADIGEGKMPIRLFGTGIAELIGHDYTGVDYLFAIKAEHRASVLNRDRHCARQPCGLRLDLTATTPLGRIFDYNVMALPAKRGDNAFSLIHMTSMEQPRNWRELPASVLNCRAVKWVDIGAGIPSDPPWSEREYCS